MEKKKLNRWIKVNQKMYNADYFREWRKRKMQDPAYRAKKSASDKLWRQSNPSYSAAYNKSIRKAFANSVQGIEKRDQRRKIMEERKLNKPERRRAWMRRRIENLHDWYVRLDLSRGTHIPISYWPQSIVDARRASILLSRELRKYKKCTIIENQFTEVGTHSADPRRIA